MSIEFHLPPAMVQVFQVIHVVAWRGDGSKKNPERLIHLYYSLDGRLLACYDELNGAPDSFVVPGESIQANDESLTHQAEAL